MSSVPEDIAKQIKKAASPDETAVAKYLSEHPNPADEAFHAWAESQGFDVDKTEAMAYRLATTHAKFLEGGRAKGKELTPAAVDQEQLRMGVEVEREHTPDEMTAQRIALDHLAEIPDYYTRLKEMEAGAKKTLDTSTAADGKTASEKPIHARNGTMKLSQLSALLQKTAATCPGGKLRSKGKGRGLGHGKGKGPIGVPFGAKKSEDQLVQALQQVKLAQALKEAQLSPEQTELLKQVLPDLVTPGAGQTGALKGLGIGAGAGGTLGAILGALQQPRRFGPSRGQLAEAGGVGGAVLGAGVGAGVGGIGGVIRGRKKARKAVEHASGESEEKPKKKEKEDVSEKESQAFMIGFLAKCAEAGCTAQELEKIAVNWQAILAGLKQSPGSLMDLLRGKGMGAISKATAGVQSTIPGLEAAAGKTAPNMRTQDISRLMGMLGLGGGAVAAPAALAGGIAGRAAAPEPPDTLGEKLRALMQQ